jgi:hypothetical protein
MSDRRGPDYRLRFLFTCDRYYSGEAREDCIATASMGISLDRRHGLLENRPRHVLHQARLRQLPFDLGSDALGDLDQTGHGVSNTSGGLRPPRGPSRIKTVAVGISADLCHEGVVDTPKVSEFIAEFQQIHIHAEGVRPVQASVREVLKTKSAIPMGKGAHGDADGRHDLRGAAEVLHPISVS